jgi:hypothetical protein
LNVARVVPAADLKRYLVVELVVGAPAHSLAAACADNEAPEHVTLKGRRERLALVQFDRLALVNLTH